MLIQNDINDDLVFNLLNNPSIEGRRNAAIELAKKKDPKYTDALIKALGDHEDVAIFAMLALVQIGNPAINKLREALNTDNEQIRCYIVEILGELKAEEVIEDLINLLKNDKSKCVKSSVIEAIKKFNGEKSIQILKNLLNSNDNSLIASACVALHNANYNEQNLMNILLQKLLESLDDEKTIISWAIVEIGSKPDITKLEEISNKTKDQNLKKIILEIVREINSRI